MGHGKSIAAFMRADGTIYLSGFCLFPSLTSALGRSFRDSQTFTWEVKLRLKSICTTSLEEFIGSFHLLLSLIYSLDFDA